MITSKNLEQPDDDIETPSKKIKLSHYPDDDLGLTEYIDHECPEVTGIIKSRIEDFIVSELNAENVVCQLTAYDVPERKYQEFEVFEMMELPESTTSLLKQVLDGTFKEVEIAAPDDKQERKKLHFSIAKYDRSLATSTKIIGEKRVIGISLVDANSDRYRKLDENYRYLYFSVLKWNISTNDVILKLANILKVHPKRFGYAGLKDKRGITLQRMSCRSLEANRLAGITRKYVESLQDASSKGLIGSNFLLGDFVYKPEGTFLGDNCGNRFSVVIRNCNIKDHEKCEIIRASLATNGFLNYFGKQRFGNIGNTHIVGKYILSKGYKCAINEILKPNKESQKADIFEALEAYEKSNNASTSIAHLKFKTGIEGLILSSLATKPSNFKEAIKKLPRKQQTLYCHAYQSFIFNRLLSKRVKRFGLAVLPGDLVYKDGDVIFLSEDDVDAYTIDQVLLPLPGISVKLPENDCKNIFEDIVNEEGIDFNNLNKATAKEFDISGSYRKIVVIPENLSISLINYSNPTDKLIVTEYDKLLGIEFKHNNEGDMRALRLQFDLPKSAYATMLIREIGKGKIE